MEHEWSSKTEPKLRKTYRIIAAGTIVFFAGLFVLWKLLEGLLYTCKQDMVQERMPGLSHPDFLQHLTEGEDALHSYTNQNNTYQIPIERAMEVFLNETNHTPTPADPQSVDPSG